MSLFWQCCFIQGLWSKVHEILTFNNIEIQFSYFNTVFVNFPYDVLDQIDCINS